MNRSAFIASLLPLWLALFLFIVDRRYFDAASKEPPSLLGIPFGLLLLVLAAALMVVGFLAMRAARSRAWSVLAFTFLTAPATLLVLLTPAWILILINLEPQR